MTRRARQSSYTGRADRPREAGSQRPERGPHAVVLAPDGRPSGTPVWTALKAVSHYSTPLACEDCVYYVNKAGLLFCLHQETGVEYSVMRIGGPCWGLAVGGGHVYRFIELP